MAGIVAYYRVSTAEQGRSGLGLEGQEAAVEAYAKQVGQPIVARYIEIESGRKSDRPKLAKALGHARRAKGTLVIAKLDRLARNVAFLSALMESGTDFKACDNPHADPFTIHILAAVAEKEAKDISARTKSALAAYKARGGQLGSDRPGHWDGACWCPDCHRDGLKPDCERCGGTGVLPISRQERRQAGLTNARIKAIEVRRKNARQAVADLLPELTAYRTEGMSLAKIAKRLNADGHTTRRGKPWNAAQVMRVLDRAAAS